jgi:hypothetical protein
MEYPELYKEKLGKCNQYYIPDDFHYCVIDPYFNNWKYADVIDNKCFYDIYFPDVKQPEAIGFRINGMWYTGEKIPSSFLTIKEKVIDAGSAFIKAATEFCGGHGICYINGSDIEVQFCKAVEQITGDIVIQKGIVQHGEMAKLNESSVNTVRLISLLKEDGVKVYSSFVRMGINGAKVDNASSGGIVCGIKQDGTLKDVAYSLSGEKYDCHPDTGIHFSDIKMPKYEAMLAMVEKLHPSLPHFRLVSWDIAIDENEELVLLEVNLKSGGIFNHQLSNGPLFGNDTDAILSEIQNSVR